jgi:hypothetical protein
MTMLPGFMRSLGLFMLKSAYHLAVKNKLHNEWPMMDEGSSSCTDGGRSLYNEIWSTKSYRRSGYLHGGCPMRV